MEYKTFAQKITIEKQSLKSNDINTPKMIWEAKTKIIEALLYTPYDEIPFDVQESENLEGDKIITVTLKLAK